VNRRPLLSVCIPTHHGRRQNLQGAIDSVLDQLTDDTRPFVELCVRDNASADGTQELLQEYVRDHGSLVRYVRNDHDAGSARNILAVVAMAAGDYCWLLGSDDVIASDGIARILALISEHPAASGFTVQYGQFDKDLRSEIRLPPAGVLPTMRTQRTVFESADDVAAECGRLMCVISANIFKRDAWLIEVQDRESEIVERFGMFPPTWVYLRMAIRQPCWVWHPRKLTIERQPSVDVDEVAAGEPIDRYFDEKDRKATRHRWLREAFAHIRRLSGDLNGPSSSVGDSWATGMARWFTDPWFLRGLKLSRHHTLLDDWDMISGCLRCFGLSRSSRSALPTLLTPHFISKAVLRFAKRRAARPIETRNGVVRVEARVPDAMPTRHTLLLECRLANSGLGAFSSRARWTGTPHFLGYRWFNDADQYTAGGWSPILRTVRSRRAVVSALDIATPWEPGRYELRISLCREDGTWLDDVDERTGLSMPVEVRSDPMPAILPATQ
jgi:glycosyltransferase involved in cell wall biosynthesis